MNKETLFTSEYVTCGHPDKVCDIVSDSILDAYLDKDPDSRVAVETLVCEDNLIVAGEVTSKGDINTEDIIKKAITDIGYVYDDMKFNVNNIKIQNMIHKQSPDISMGVDINGAGDQGIMFGGAVAGIDKVSYMPDCWKLSKELSQLLVRLHKDQPNKIRCDGKTQVTLNYVSTPEGGTIKYWDSIVVSVQHSPNVTNDEIKNLVIENVIIPVVDKYKDAIIYDDNIVNIYINPTGRFVIGGPDGDTGLTGRKIVVDGYGGFFPVGGGAFSGKDPTKVDRSGAYMARYLAKNILIQKQVQTCEVQLSYAIGISKPVSVLVKCNGSDDLYMSNYVMNNIDMDPKSIIDRFDLQRRKNLFRYADLASNGHFGSEFLNLLPWEKVDLFGKMY